MTTRSEDLDRDSTEDVRWRLELAMDRLDSGLVMTALDLIVEAGEVVEAMLERWQADKRREARLSPSVYTGDEAAARRDTK